MKKIITLIIILTLMILFPITTKARAQSDERLINMGEFKITYYCSCERCSEDWGTQTSTGNHCEQGRTVAVDPSVIAYGTRILLGDNIYVAEDCGGAVCGDHIDVYVEDHDLVEKLGVRYRNIWLIK